MNDIFARVAATEVLNNKELLNLLKFNELTMKTVRNYYPSKFKKIQQHPNYSNFEKLALQAICFTDEEYPDNLRQTYNPPAIIYYCGNIELLKSSIIGIVGARKGTDYSKNAIEKVCQRLSKNKVIVSGMAHGVDSMAHISALNNKLTGIDGCYPTSNLELKKKIMKFGLVISEYPINHKTRPYHFVERNRIIAGLADTLIVTEAKKKSGSLITASLSLENNREVYALPGSTDHELSEGTNELIRDGAQVLLL